MMEPCAGSPPPEAPDLLHVGVDSWIIQDGNYEDFHSGGEYRFALAFYPRDVASAPPGSSPRLQHRAGGRYDARGSILHFSESAWVVDFGIPAFKEGPPPSWARSRGQSIEGSIYIGIDPFFYMEDLNGEAGMPDLFRTWRVRRILLETTPWVQAGERMRIRDHSRESFREVSVTNAWDDDGGYGHYVLECELRSRV